MRLSFVEVANFRKLRSVRIDLSEKETIFVGANNSGKTSAMVAMRRFLIDSERSKFTMTDFTLSNWNVIDTMGRTWEEAAAKEEPCPPPDFVAVAPVLDVWLHVEDDEIHYVRKILPTLDWAGGALGVRLQLEAREPASLQADYLSARKTATSTVGGGGEGLSIEVWPRSLTDFLSRHLRGAFCVRAYVLDPQKCESPVNGVAHLQVLPEGSEPIDGDPLRGLIRIDEISAQRGFGYDDGAGLSEDEARGSVSSHGRLSEQLRRYYSKHLDPTRDPQPEDLGALGAIQTAQKAFDERLREGFRPALSEVQHLGYPGVSDPQLMISTRLTPIDGLDHDSAVQYLVNMLDGEDAVSLYLPEESNGLGYQNLISMVFRLMTFRDGWMRVGKANGGEESPIPPLHLVLLEEPEAHLHTQVQQVFIRQAYRILRNHEALGKGSRFSTQLVVSTHSSHLAHECTFASLRYFRRMSACDNQVPTCKVINLGNVFGEDANTERFVTRYLKVTHCDLLFADAAVLIEGPAERILVPYFLRNQEEFTDLLECYITWLEIGGSHAHRLRKLIESLGLTTLIITDLDPVDEDGKKTRPSRDSKLKTRNATLKSWCPAIESLDELLDMKPEQMAKSYEKENLVIRVAFQQPIQVEFAGAEQEVLSYTFEDALVFENLETFKEIQGGGLQAKFREAITQSTSAEAIGGLLFDALKDGDKASLALDLLDIEDPADLKAPQYIREGLVWLKRQLRTDRERLGLAEAQSAVGDEAEVEG